MKRLITILRYLSIGLGTISLFFILYSVTTLLSFDSSVNFADTVDNIYKALVTYSDLYKFTVIVCAFWVTLRQLEISQSNYDNTFEQIKFVQDDIIDKRKKDITNDTLKQCNFYLQELQVAYKELIETDIMNGAPPDWQYLQTLTSPSLEEKYPILYKKFNAINRPTKNQVLITLYKLEAFSSLFVHGNLDKQLAKTIIGNTYSKQVGYLVGLISYFREDTTTVFGQNTIKLYSEWRTDEEKV